MISERDGEPFTASADCPKCGVIDVHWLDEPRPMLNDGSPLALFQRSVDDMMYMMSMGGGSMFDMPGTVVARICTKCEHRWGQR